MEELFKFMEFSTELMKEAGMDLRQWEYGPSQDQEKTTTMFLGLHWNKAKDWIYCDIPRSQLPIKTTKRIVLSFIQKIFDPLGFLAPAILKMKLLLRDAFVMKLDWDEEIPEQMKN